MDNYLYNCQYCGKEYKPNRRHKQKFCSNSCRANFFNRKKKNQLALKPNKSIETQKPLQIEKISWAGVGNAAVGTLAVNALTSIFTKEENKPATKKDIRDIKEILSQRYLKVNNMANDIYGKTPYYDIRSKGIVYLKPNS